MLPGWGLKPACGPCLPFGNVNFARHSYSATRYSKNVEYRGGGGVDFGVLLLPLHTESDSHENLNFPAGGLFPGPDWGIEQWKPTFGSQPQI